MPAHESKTTRRLVTGNQIDKIGCEWNNRRRTFEIHCSEGPPLALTPHELVELGVELVMEGTKAMTEKRWH
jgi:hypothetical protein